MISVAINFSHEIEGSEVRITAMIDESAFVAIKGSIDTQRKEVLIRALLHLHVVLIRLIRVIHVKQVAHAYLIIGLASLVAFLSS